MASLWSDGICRLTPTHLLGNNDEFQGVSPLFHLSLSDPSRDFDNPKMFELLVPDKGSEFADKKLERGPSHDFSTGSAH